MDEFRLVSDFKPTGDQPEAIEQLVEGIKHGDRMQTLLGVTGSGKTFTMANVIARLNRPCPIRGAEQDAGGSAMLRIPCLFSGCGGGVFCFLLRLLPAGYLHSGKDMYIEKDALINDEIDRLRHSATSALFERRDVIIVASVSCIYSLVIRRSTPRLSPLRPGMVMSREELIRKLIFNSYNRNDLSLTRDGFRVGRHRGDHSCQPVRDCSAG